MCCLYMYIMHTITYNTPYSYQKCLTRQLAFHWTQEADSRDSMKARPPSRGTRFTTLCCADAPRNLGAWTFTPRRTHRLVE